jgi:hypothetical protein
VPNATRPALQSKLENRTRAFRAVERSAQAIEDYQQWVRATEAERPLDEAIHVCEFAGFLDPLQQIVGCQLHPTAPGNQGVDLRGLCYYGSMACKSFFCPAWEEVPLRFQDMVCLLIHDWHLYGLVMTDVDFVRSVFGLLEDRIDGELDPTILQSDRATTILTHMLSSKDSWPFAGSSSLRRNRYYFKGAAAGSISSPGTHMERLLKCLGYTFGKAGDVNEGQGFVQDAIEEFATVYRDWRENGDSCSANSPFEEKGILIG